MAEEPAPASAEERNAVAETPEAPVAAAATQTPDEPTHAATPAQPPTEAQQPSKSDRIGALIRNGLANTAISQSAIAWLALETRLPEIVAAILQEA